MRAIQILITLISFSAIAEDLGVPGDVQSLKGEVAEQEEKFREPKCLDHTFERNEKQNKRKSFSYFYRDRRNRTNNIVRKTDFINEDDHTLLTRLVFAELQLNICYFRKRELANSFAENSIEPITSVILNRIRFLEDKNKKIKSASKAFNVAFSPKQFAAVHSKEGAIFFNCPQKARNPELLQKVAQQVKALQESGVDQELKNYEVYIHGKRGGFRLPTWARKMVQGPKIGPAGIVKEGGCLQLYGDPRRFPRGR